MTLGKTAHGQSGVFLCSSSPKGHALLDSRLYLPQCWFEPEWAPRREPGRIPEDVTFQTRPQLAVELLQPLLEKEWFRGRWITTNIGRGRPGPGIRGWCFWRSCFWCGCG